MESSFHAIAVEGRWFMRHDANAHTNPYSNAYAYADPDAYAHTDSNGLRLQPVQGRHFRL
jgi:hypothetical protein